MYGLTNFLAVLWHTVAGWFGFGRGQAHPVTLFNGSDRSEFPDSGFDGEERDYDGQLGGFNLEADVRYTNPHGWGLDTRN